MSARRLPGAWCLIFSLGSGGAVVGQYRGCVRYSKLPVSRLDFVRRACTPTVQTTILKFLDLSLYSQEQIKSLCPAIFTVFHTTAH